MRRFAPLVAYAVVVAFGSLPASAQDASGDSRRNPRGDRSGRMERTDRESRGNREDRSDSSRGERRGRHEGGRTREGDGDGSFELRGFFGAGHDTEVSLRQSGTDKAYWIRLGDRNHDIYVERVDPVVGTAVIVTGGTRYRLRLAGEIPVAARSGPQVLGEVGATGTTAAEAPTVTIAIAAPAPATPAAPPAPASSEPAPAAPVQIQAPNDPRPQQAGGR